MGWSQLTKCRALKVRHLVPETDPLIQIKNKAKIMKNLVPDSIKYSSMSSFTYSSFLSKPMELLKLSVCSEMMPKERLKVTSGRKSKAQHFRGSGCTLYRGEAPQAPCSRKEADLRSLLLPGFYIFT